MLVDANSESISKNPIYGEIAGEVGTLICYAPIEKEWQRQAYIALNRSLFRYGWYKIRGLKDLPYAYLILAELHDYFNPFKPIITSELQELQRKDSRIGISPLFCKNCLREIRNDLMQRGLLPDAGIQLSRQVENFIESEKQRTPDEDLSTQGHEEPIEGKDAAEKVKPVVKLSDDEAKSKKSRISLKEANVRAREIFEKEPNPYNIKVRDLVEKIPCSIGLVPKLPVWKAVQERKKQEKPKKSRKAKKVRLTDKMLKIAGSGKKDQVINQLVVDQEADKQEDDRQAKLYLNHKKKPLTRD